MWYVYYQKWINMCLSTFDNLYNTAQPCLTMRSKATVYIFRRKSIKICLYTDSLHRQFVEQINGLDSYVRCVSSDSVYVANH